MKRAVLSQPIYPTEAYREDYEMLTDLNKPHLREMNRKHRDYWWNMSGWICLGIGLVVGAFVGVWV